MSIPRLNKIFSRYSTVDNIDLSNMSHGNMNIENQSEECSEKEILLKTIKRQVKQLMEEFVNRKYVHEYSSNVISLCASIESCLLLGLKRRALGLFKESSSLALLEKIAKQNAAARSICTLMSNERLQNDDSLSDISHHSSNTNSSMSSKSDYSNSSTFGHSWSTSSFLSFNSSKFFSSNNPPSDNEFVNLHWKNLVKHYWIRLALTEKVLDKIIDYLVKNSGRFYNNGSIIGDPCYGYILVSLLSGPCSLEYSRVKNTELLVGDPGAFELIQKQKIQNQSGSTGIEAGKSPNLNHANSTSSLFWSSGSNQFINKPALVNRNRLTGSDLNEYSNSGNRSPHSTPRQYVESLHQSSSSNLLFGKNNVYCQPRDDVNKMPGYLSLHMAVSDLLIKWTPNELMSGGLSDSPIKENSVKIEWDCALIIWVNKIVYIHCHQHVDKGETLVLVNHDGSQNPPFDFPQGEHLMLFLTCLENGLLPRCRLDPPLWKKKNREKLFQKSCDESSIDGNNSGVDGPKSAEYIETTNKNKTIFLWTSKDKSSSKFNWFQQPFNKRLTIGSRKVLSQPLEHIVFDFRQSPKRESSSNEFLIDLVFRIVRPRNYNHSMSEYHSGDEDLDEFNDVIENSMSTNEFHSNHQITSHWHSDYTAWAMKKRCRLTNNDKTKRHGKSSSIRLLCSSMKKEILARSFYGWLAYSRHMKTIRNHLHQLVLSVDLVKIKNKKELVGGLTKELWNSAFNSNDQISNHMEILHTIYHGGCAHELRVQVWPFILGLYSWESTKQQREDILQNWIKRYQIATSDWMVIEAVLNEQENDSSSPLEENEDACAIEIEHKSENNSWKKFSKGEKSETKVIITRKLLNILKQNWNRIIKDVTRCDRHFGFFGQTKQGEANLSILQRIMCTWVWENVELGYIQGMCDLLAPLLVVFQGNEELTFACFSKYMERMISSFPVKDSSKMDLCFSRMRSAVQILDSDLLDHMQSYGDFTHFYFSYRWFLLDFKREFTYKDVFCVWETIWAADHVASQYFSLFVGLALLLSYRDVIIDNGMEFTDIIRFFNEMAEKHNAIKVLELARELVEKLQLLLQS